MTDKRRVLDERLCELRQMYADGERLDVIAVALGVTAKTLRETVADLGLKPRQLKRVARTLASPSSVDTRQLLAAYEDSSNSVESILQRFDIPLARLYAELQRAGYPKRKQMPSTVSELSRDDRDRIVVSYTEGKSAKRIASEHGLTYDQVYVVLREAKVPMQKDIYNPRHSQPDIRERFKELYADETMSVAEIIQRLRITDYDYKKLVVDLQLAPRRKGGGKRSIPSAVIARMPEYARRYEAGESMAKLAAEAGIGLATMKVRLKKLQR